MTMIKVLLAVVFVCAVMFAVGCISDGGVSSNSGSRDLSKITYPVTATFDLPDGYIEDDFTVTLHAGGIASSERHYGIPTRSEWRGGNLNVVSSPGREDIVANCVIYQIRDDYTSNLRFTLFDDGTATIGYMSEFYKGTWK